jgi:hypothetical protein
VHPALIDSDSDSEDDGPSLADALLAMQGLIGERPCDGLLEGLLERYADDEAQPLQVRYRSSVALMEGSLALCAILLVLTRLPSLLPSLLPCSRSWTRRRKGWSGSPKRS